MPAGQKHTPAPAKTEAKKTRVVLTPAERIAAAEAHLATLRAKEETKAKAKVTALDTEVAKVDAKIAELQTKRSKLAAERDALTETVPADEPAVDES